MSSSSVDRQLEEACVKYRDDPYMFTQFMYDWDGAQLSDWGGPDAWHREVMDCIKAYYEGPETKPLRIAIASGHGAAKTALAAWIMRWFISCRHQPQIVCTANTEAQLSTKTWRELAKWHKLALNQHWFEWTATQYYLKASPETWRANAIPWSENNTEAFAGTHEENVLVVFDEASKISDKIWEVTDGIFTTNKNLWVVLGNGTRNAGRFYECFHGNKKYWKTWQIDSRTCKAANKDYLNELIEQYGGEHTDEAKVRVLGQFPEKASGQLIATSAVERAQSTQVEAWEYSPKVMGIDVARSGANQTEIAIRQGRKVFPIIRVPKFPEGNLMMQAEFIAGKIREEKPAMICVDASGVGGGVVDRLRQLGFQVMSVNAGNASINPRFLNKRAEMYWEMKEFIELGECELPPGKDLQKHLTCTEYDYTDKGRIRLKRKEDILKEYDFSPDMADALSFTFAYPVGDVFEEMDVDPVTYQDS